MIDLSKKQKPDSFSLRADPELIDKIDAAAKKHGISRNEAINRFLASAVEEYEAQEKRRGK